MTEDLNDRLPEGGTKTAKINYTYTGYGNDHGLVQFGAIDKKAEVTSGVQLNAKDGRHLFTMDNDGERKGWTSSVSPGTFQLVAGLDNKEPDNTLMINAHNGDITIVASNGKIRLQGTDIELFAVGEGGSKGNIRIDANENITQTSKSLIVNASFAFTISTVGIGLISANTVLKMYGSVIRGVTDAVAVKDSKVGGIFIQIAANILNTVALFTR